MRHKLRIFILTLALFTALLYSEEAVLDYRTADLSHEILSLKGDWDFYWHQLIYPEDPQSPTAELIQVPGAWNINKDYPARGYGSYRVKVLLPEVSYPLGISTRFSLNQYRLYANGDLLIENGKPGKSRAKNSRRDPLSVRLLPAGQEIEILYQASNYDDIHGGLLDAIHIGSYDNLTRGKNRSVIFNAFLFGVLFVTGMLYISFYITKKDDPASLYFGLFSLTLSLRTVLYGEHLLLLIFPQLSVELENVLAHMTLYLSVPLFLNFIAYEYPFKLSRNIKLPVYTISAFYTLLIMVTPHHYYIQFLLFYQILALIISLTIFGVIIIYTIRKNTSAKVTLSGFLIMLIAFINDILYSQGIIYTAHIIPASLAIFIMSQATLLSWNIGKAFSDSKVLSQELINTNNSFKRFVPEEFLKILGKEKIRDIQLGDNKQLEMTIMFCDIRDFTSLSENLTPKENFLFINSYLERIGPVIRTYGGFIDKYVGDGIMALFPDSADSAVKAAIQMQEQITIYNTHRKSYNYKPIRVGIGIHSGSLMLGTVGENKRMDSTVISDAVNLCARIENLTKEYGLNIAISEASWDKLTEKDSMEERFIGQMYLKGKSAPVPIYEIFNTDPPEILEAKKRLKEKFYRALAHYNNDMYQDSENIFSEILKELPTDRTSQVYLFKSREKQETPPFS